MFFQSLKVNLFGILVFAGVLFTFSFTHAASPQDDDASQALIAKGRELFNAKEGLGVKFACILCHKNDKAIKRVEIEKLGSGLPDMINQQIVKKAKGTVQLAKDSEEMKALVAYIKNEHSI